MTAALFLAASDWQTPAALLFVVAALGYMTRGWWWPKRAKSKPGCGAGCGCSVTKVGGLKHDV